MRTILEPAPQTLLGNPREAAAPLALWMNLTLFTGVLSVPLLVAIGVSMQRTDAVMVAGYLALTVVVVLALRLQLTRHLVLTAAIVAIASVVGSLCYVYLVPDLYLLLPVAGVMAALVCSPYLRAPALKVFTVTTWFVFTVAMILAHLSAHQAMPWWFLVLCGSSVMGTTFIMLLQFNERLFNSMFSAWRVDRQRSFLALAGEALAESLDLQTTLTTASRLAVPFLADGCVIDVVNDDGKLERMALHYVGDSNLVFLGKVQPFTPDLERHTEHPVVQAIKTGHSVLLANPDAFAHMVVSGAHYDFLNRMDIRSMMAVPFGAHGRVLGAFLLVTMGNTPVLSENTIPVAEEFARRVGLCIDNARLYREARDAVRLRDDFLSIASHELRTPLTTLRLQTDGAVRLLQADGDNERILKRLAMAQQQASRLEGLIRALLEVNSVTAKAAVLDSHMCDLRRLVRGVVDRFQEEATRAGSSLHLIAPEEVWGAWDVVRLDQVMTNLVTNAVKYGAGKPIEIKLVSDPQHAYFSVADRGIGIAADDQQRIFDRFERAVSTRNYGGFGLGLWVARTLVNAAGGEIEVVSKPKEGAVFTVTLPRNLGGLKTTDLFDTGRPVVTAPAGLHPN